MGNPFEDPFSENASEEREETNRKLYEDNVKKEKKYTNEIGDTFVYEGTREGIQKVKTALSEKEIMEDDAERINELRDKEKTDTLTNTEKEELHFRETSDLFMSEVEERGGSLSFIGSNREGPFNKESFYPLHIIEGTVDGKKISLSRTTYPDFSEEQLIKESST